MRGDEGGRGARTGADRDLKVMECDGHCSRLKVRKLLRVVDELRDLVEPELLRLLAENEEDAVHDVALARPIWTDHRTEVCVEWTYLHPARVRLEIVQHQAMDGEARPTVTRTPSLWG